MERFALKVQRRRYTRAAVYEVFIHHHIRKQTGPGEEIVRLHEAFLHDGHVCMAFQRHGSSLERALARGSLPVARVKQVTRRLLGALDRLHRCGYAHTDVKPDNVLYDGRTGLACLADLGGADKELRQGHRMGTREYMPPEILLGSPLSTSLDLWGLGCTVFEMLTGRLLFAPRRAARQKYREFSRGRDAIEVPLAESELRDRAVEKAEQLTRGDTVAQKYRVTRRLGGGGFATVWSAEIVSDADLDGSYQTLWNYAQQPSGETTSETERDRTDRLWRRAKGAEDLLDLALNYEHILLIDALLGPVPPSMLAAGRFRESYFEADGHLRFKPPSSRISLRDRLRRETKLRREALGSAIDFLQSLLSIDPASRPTSANALQHPWLQVEQ